VLSPVRFMHLVVYLNVFLPMLLAVGVTGLKASTLRDNWGSRYQFTNDAGIPAPTGFYWDFEYVFSHEIFSL